MRLQILAALGAVLLATQATAQPRASGTPLLVSTTWLAEHLHDSNLVLLQTSQAPPGAAQIPGARFLPHASLMTMGANHDVAAPADLLTALERAGVSNASHVVVYGEPLAAGWLFFVLDYLGHESTSMLDGGLDKWQREARPVSPATTSATPGHFQPRLRPELKASSDTVQKTAPSSVALLDARSEGEYDSGHIPGARLLTWQTVYADPSLQVFKSQQEVAALFKAAGATDDRSAITYCQIGLRSSLLYFAARYAGLKASNYVGSWSDWTARGLPTEPSIKR